MPRTPGPQVHTSTRGDAKNTRTPSPVPQVLLLFFFILKNRKIPRTPGPQVQFHVPTSSFQIQEDPCRLQILAAILCFPPITANIALPTECGKNDEDETTDNNCGHAVVYLRQQSSSSTMSESHKFPTITRLRRPTFHVMWDISLSKEYSCNILKATICDCDN